ncbi:MAG: propanediol utilization protein, partial [Ruminococcus sp.]|nr:propanediol utilization protein [Ruminococcus sp.]
MSKNFIVETSARHIHVTQEHLEILFGKSHELTKKKDLSQPGQFACEERVTRVGRKKGLASWLLYTSPRPRARTRSRIASSPCEEKGG